MKFGQDNKYKVIVHNTTYLSVLEILKMVMPFVALPYLISTVGADKYGLVVFAQAIISYFIIFINFGLDVSAVKNVSINRSDNEKLSEVVSSVLIIKAFLFILSFLALGDSSKIKVGESVYAIGNPIGFEFRRTVTSGIISAKNRSIKLEENNSISYMSDLIQTDATINPGNSGGPLINPNGEVIGINTVKISSADGIGFAIPINVVKGVIESFKNTGKFEQPTLGIYVYDKDVIPYLDNNIITFTKGIYVAQINKNGPAYNTELKEGDIINTVDNKEINTMNDLREYVYTKNVGDVVELNITRGKVNKVIKVVLRKKVKYTLHNNI